MGFANYVVGNAVRIRASLECTYHRSEKLDLCSDLVRITPQVAKFWKQHMNALPEDPFAGALGVAKKGTLAKSAQGAHHRIDRFTLHWSQRPPTSIHPAAPREATKQSQPTRRLPSFP